VCLFEVKLFDPHLFLLSDRAYNMASRPDRTYDAVFDSLVSGVQSHHDRDFQVLSVNVPDAVREEIVQNIDFSSNVGGASSPSFAPQVV
jgi:hypothetical protein